MADYSIHVLEFSYSGRDGTEEMMKQTGYESHRVIPIHEEGLADTFPCRISKEGLRISEICLADGAESFVK